MKEETFEAGEFIFKENKKDDHFYLILAGEAEIVKKTGDEEAVLARLGTGEWLGEGVLSSAKTRSFGVRAKSRTTALGLTRQKFYAAAKKYPWVAVNFLLNMTETLSERLRSANSKLLSLYEISLTLSQYADHPSQLASQLVRQFMTLTDSKTGAFFLKNQFTQKYRCVYRYSSAIPDSAAFYSQTDSGGFWSKDQKNYLTLPLNDQGFIVLKLNRRPSAKTDDLFSLLALMADPIARALKETSEKAAQKAKKMLGRKSFER